MTTDTKSKPFAPVVAAALGEYETELKRLIVNLSRVRGICEGADPDEPDPEAYHRLLCILGHARFTTKRLRALSSCHAMLAKLADVIKG